MKKSPRKLEMKALTIVSLTKKDLAIVDGGGRSKTGNCPVFPCDSKDCPF